ncbi:MAG: hypothetical protein KatS3mg084_0580 [Candidatus Dojkabacteria bacterium]|nr:MAG: hypothetical protein KatS3mg084_0580 [Candidatus Dojkabacteria bacterium]
MVQMYKYLYKLLLVFLVLLAPGLPHQAKANSIGEYSARIEEVKRKQNETRNKINQINKTIRSITSTINSLSAQLAALREEKTKLEEQVKLFNQQIEDQERNIQEFENAIKQREADVKAKVNYLYKLSFNNPNSILSDEGDLKDFFDKQFQTNFLIDLYTKEIKEFYEKLEYAKKLREQLSEDKKFAEVSIKDLDEKIASINDTIVQNRVALGQATQTRNALNAELNTLSGQLQFLSAERQRLLQAELNKMSSVGQVPKRPLVPGQYYFEGRGRDRVDGHGLGMSQWGAYGMAEKGFTYDQILTFYYPGTVIGDYNEPEKVIVDENRELSIDEYLAGIGEVPNNWPDEAIKAQIVAARTYLMGVCGSQKVCRICGSDRCQVYVGGEGKMPFVQATKGKVILYNNEPIVAYYSASHRGCSSKISTVWGGSDLPYIQTVRDDNYAEKDYYTENPYPGEQNRIYPYNWKWRTNSYTFSDLKDVFDRHEKLRVGDVVSVEILHVDECGRVGRIRIKGTEGEKTLTGWDFRAIFNEVTPFNDFVYSTEFVFKKVE